MPLLFGRKLYTPSIGSSDYWQKPIPIYYLREYLSNKRQKKVLKPLTNLQNALKRYLKEPYIVVF